MKLSEAFQNVKNEIREAKKFFDQSLDAMEKSYRSELDMFAIKNERALWYVARQLNESSPTQEGFIEALIPSLITPLTSSASFENRLADLILIPPNQKLMTKSLEKSETFHAAMHEKLLPSVKYWAKEAIEKLDFEKIMEEKFGANLDKMVKQSLANNDVDKYRMRSALALFVIQLHTAAIIAQTLAEEGLGRNVLKRI